MLFSCSNGRSDSTKDNGSLYVNPVKVQVNTTITNIDSTNDPVVVLVDEKKLKKIKVGAPLVIPTNTNIVKSRTPKTFPAEDQIISSEKEILPQVVKAKGKLLSLKMPESVKALPAVLSENAVYDIRSLDIDQGLNSSFIRGIAEDSVGNLWIALEGGGLCKYDGESFLHFTTKEGLVNNFIESVFYDHHGNIWFGYTDHGIVKYDGNTFMEFTEAGGYSIRCIVEDKKGNIWFSTENGVSKYDGINFSNYSFENSSLNKRVNAILEDKDGTMWLGTQTGVLLKFDGTSVTKIPISGVPGSFEVTALAEDKKGNIWIALHAGGLVKYNGNSFTHFSTNEGLSDNSVWDVLVDKNDNIWVATYGGGVCKFNPLTNEFTCISEKQGLRSKYVVKLFMDHSGNLWFGTLGGGLCKYKEESFVHFSEAEGLSNSLIWNIIEDGSGNIWIGTNNGLCKYNGKSFSQYNEEQGLPGKYIWCLLEESKGKIWIGTSLNGACLFDEKDCVYYTKKDGLADDRVKTIYKDDKNNIWFGTEGGLTKFDGKYMTTYTKENGLSDNHINSIVQDKKGILWIGTSSGLNKFDGTHFTKYSLDNENPDLTVYSSKESVSGDLWLGTNAGLINFNSKNKENGGDTFTLYANKNTNENQVVSLLLSKTRKGTEMVWAGTSRGLFTLNADQISSNQIKWNNYSSKEGLKSIGFYLNASLYDSKGNAWWGTEKSLTRLDLNSYQFPEKAPVLDLNEIKLNGSFTDYKRINDSSNKKYSKIKFSGVAPFSNYPTELSLPYYTNHLTFRYSAIDWTAPSKIQYQFFMDGLDKSWSSFSSSNEAEFRNMPYGTFNFKIRAISLSGEISNEVNYVFTIRPPWWHTWWFRIAAVLALLFSIYQYTRYRTRSLRERQKYLQQTVEKRTEQLRESLTEKEALLKEIHHRVKNNLEVISSLLMLQTMNVTDEKAKAALTEGQSRVQSIALIHHKLYRNEDMGSVELCGFSKDLFKQVKDVFNQPGNQVECKINDKEIWLSTERAVPFGLILNELFTNTFKYAIQPEKANNVSISIEEKVAGEKINYMFIYRDSGAGMPADFNQERSSSLGMKVIHLLTRQLNGSSKFYNDNGLVFEMKFAKVANNENTVNQKKEI